MGKAWDKSIYPGMTEGPFGFPMAPDIAREIERVQKSLPDGDEFEFRRAFVESKVAETIDGSERADISIISTQAIDRDREVVICRGMDLSQFRKNPVVVWAHRYDSYPVGKAQWVKYDRETDSLKAKTIYAPRPPGHEGEWYGDTVYHLVKEGFLKGKSIGFLPLEVGPPTPDEIKKSPAWANVYYVIRKALLLEYSIVPVPSNQEALVQAVGKSVRRESLVSLGFDIPDITEEPIDDDAGNASEKPASKELVIDEPDPVVSEPMAELQVNEPVFCFRTQAELERSIRARVRRAVETIDVRGAIRDSVRRLCGRVD